MYALLSFLYRFTDTNFASVDTEADFQHVFILEQLLTIVGLLDLSDEVGRYFMIYHVGPPAFLTFLRVLNNYIEHVNHNQEERLRVKTDYHV